MGVFFRDFQPSPFDWSLVPDQSQLMLGKQTSNKTTHPIRATLQEELTLAVTKLQLSTDQYTVPTSRPPRQISPNWTF